MRTPRNSSIPALVGRFAFCYLACVAVLGAAAGDAFAEEELRIALSEGESSVKLGGEDLAIFDARDGRLRVRFDGDVTVTLAWKGRELEARGRAAKALAGANSVFVEAKDAVRVNAGVYFGRIEVRQDPKRRGRLLVVNRLPLETYLLGIVGSEMSPSWPIEALKAQAVAARTYAMQRRAMMRAAGRPYDLASTVISQVYKGAERIRPSVVEAVKRTRGEVMSFKHDLAEALFHSTCGGRTVSSRQAFGGRVSYLTPVDCTWCKRSSRYRWKVSFSLGEVSKRLAAKKKARGAVREVRRGERDARVEIRDAKGRRRLDPRTLRKALGFSKLFSERFTAQTRQGRVHFAGRGFGHGVGLCQWGAHGQAGSGRNHLEILTHYYPGIEIKRLY